MHKGWRAVQRRPRPVLALAAAFFCAALLISASSPVAEREEPGWSRRPAKPNWARSRRSNVRIACKGRT